MLQRQPSRAACIAARAIARLTLSLGLFLVPAAADAQARLDLEGFIEVGGEAERYLRVLQIAGLVPLTPWSIQPFTPTQASAFRAANPHPWSAKLNPATGVGLAPGVELLRPKSRAIGNSSFPFQVGPGPTWAGRGLTAEIQAGVAGSWGMISAQAAPLAFIAQNSAFELARNGESDGQQYGDARYPLDIDAPQRFGARAYDRLVPGTSFLTIDTRVLVASLSSAPQQWGPARDYPLVLGPNAGGFPSLYIGTSRPFDLWLFKVHARAVYGELTQSAFALEVDGQRRRFASGLVAVITPRGIPGLELGGARFIHQPWPSDGLTLSSFRRPISAGLNLGGASVNAANENQVASVFARWAFPSAGVEVYGEMYREDYPGRFHYAPSLIEKPDDLASFTLGLQRVFSIGTQRARVVRAELVNGETSHQERGTRGFVNPLPPYLHSGVTQGHTLNGLFLGSPEAYGGAAWRIGLDEYTPAGRKSVSLERSLRFDWLPTRTDTTQVRPDIVYAIRGELLRFRGRNEIAFTLIPAVDLNRNLVARRDVFNLTAAVTLRGWLY
jgi:hypothetical protein